MRTRRSADFQSISGNHFISRRFFRAARVGVSFCVWACWAATKARGWSRSVWSAWSLLPLSMTHDVQQREQAPRTPDASRGSVAIQPIENLRYEGFSNVSRWFTVVIYATAMAWVESAVVFYLRTMVDRIDPYQPNPLPIV